MRIYKEKLEEKPEVCLKLVQDGKEVKLVMVEDGGYEKFILMRFYADGTFVRIGCISEGIGLQLDEQGRIKECD